MVNHCNVQLLLPPWHQAPRTAPQRPRASVSSMYSHSVCSLLYVLSICDGRGRAAAVAWACQLQVGAVGCPPSNAQGGLHARARREASSAAAAGRHEGQRRACIKYGSITISTTSTAGSSSRSESLDAELMLCAAVEPHRPLAPAPARRGVMGRLPSGPSGRAVARGVPGSDCTKERRREA